MATQKYVKTNCKVCKKEMTENRYNICQPCQRRECVECGYDFTWVKTGSKKCEKCRRKGGY